MRRRDAELAVWTAMLDTRRLSASEVIRTDPYWRRQAAYLGSLTQPTEKRCWTVGERPIRSWARMIAEEAVESVERRGALPEYVGPVLEPTVGLAEAIDEYRITLRQRRLHQEGRLI